MKKLVLLLVVSFFCNYSFAQFGGFGGGAPKIKGKISGSIVDSLAQQPVGFATISLKRSGKDKIVNGALSDENGDFSFVDVAPGKYDVEVSFLGYDVKMYSGIETTKKKPDYTDLKIELVSTDYLLDEVQITEKRALFENKVDRIVFNAEDDSSIAGGDATDVLRKVPNLSVDLDGNVSIRGSQNIRILINGKPSGMFSTNVADALKMFPADQIKRVEVITSPGAKYDGEGSGGIINIVTKKANIEGVAGTLNGSLGNRQSNASANINMGKGRFGSTINGSVFYSSPVDGEFTFQRTTQSALGESVLTQGGMQNTSRLGFNGSASAFYDFNAYNALNSSFTLRGFGFDQEGVFNGLLSDGLGNQLFAFNNNNVGDNLFSGFDWNTDYTRKFEANEQQELVIAYQLSKADQDTDNDILGTGTMDQFLRSENIFNDGDNWENTLQVDYTQPLPNSVKLEVGAKGVLRDISSDSRFTNTAVSPAVLDLDRSNVFDYNQDVTAGYAQFSFVIKKLQFITGMRYERTDIAGAFEDTSLGLDFDNNYDNWLPNFTISKGLKNFRNLKFSYSKRIQRPSLFNINPFRNTSDLTNVRIGNPFLDPEVTDQFEVSYNFRLVGFNVFASGYNKRTSNIIEQTLVINESGVSINSFANVGNNDSYGINMFVNKTINKFNIRFGGDIFTYDAVGEVNGEQLSNSAVNYQIFTNGEYSITSTFKADFFGFFRSDQPTLQGSTPSFSIFGIGFRKDIKNLSLGLRIIEPFSANKEFNTTQSGQNFTQISGFSLPFRSIGVNVRYKFGKVDFKERRSKIKNTDQKGGGDQQGQGGGGGGIG